MSDPTVVTDQGDYAPGSTVHIDTSGFTAGATVQFKILNLGADGIAGTGDDIAYDAWFVVDGGAGDGNALSGGLATTWTVPDDALDRTLILSATEDTDGDGIFGEDGELSATTTFTDAAGSTNKVYQHWADAGTPDWNNNILNNTKSDYFEGEVIPHVFVYKASNQAQLVNGQSYSFNITYNYYQQNTNAGGFAYITTYNLSRTPGPNDATTPYIPPTQDSTFTNGGGTQGSFYTVDANITNVSNVSYTGTGTKDGHVTVTFTYTGTTTSNGIAEIYYGLYIANPGQVPSQGAGTTDGAHAWSGGSLQTTVDIGGSGATSIQLAPDAIIVGSISGMKFNDLNGDGDRDAGENGLAGWTIFLDKDNDGVLDSGEASTITASDGTYSFSVTPDADKSDADNDGYIVREVNQAGWKQTTANPGPIVISAADPTETNVNFGNQQQNPSLNIVKDATVPGDTADAAGEVISYTITVQNTGNVTLTGVTVTDGFVSNLTRVTDVTGDNDNLLEVGETWGYTATHTVTQAEIDAGGNITNIAKADSNETPEDSDDASVPVEQKPSLNIIKDATVPGDTADAAGEVISYTIKVENTGNTTLTGVMVTDGFVSNLTRVTDVTGDNDNLLEVGETWGYTATHTVTQAEIDAGGNITNIAKADSNETPEDSEDASVPVEQKPSLNIVKDATVPGGTADAAGEVISYTIKVENTGNTTLTGVTVTDNFASNLTRVADATGDNDNLLEVGEVWKYTASHVVTQAEIDAGGNITNIAKADSNETPEDSDDASVPVEQRPSLNIVKDATVPGDTADAAGEVISYTIKVENTGNTTLTGVTVTDGFVSNLTRVTDVTGDNDNLLEVGETWGYTATHTVTQAEIDAGGNITNIAKADSNETPEDSDDASVPVEQKPAIDVEKYVSVDGGNTWVDADSPTGPTLLSTGSSPQFKFVVTNTGNVTLTGITLSDNVFNIDTVHNDKTIEFNTDLDAGNDSLSPGETYAYVYQGATWQPGQHSNTATVNSAQGATDSDAAHYFGALPGLVTNSSLCTFDTNAALAGKQFNLLFTPDFSLGSGNYKLSDSNPGQFYYNLFYQGTANKTVDIVLNIPSPFLTQGAVPVHVYDDVHVETMDGQTCLTPIGEIANYKASIDPATNTLTLKNVSTGDDGFIYLNVHLDYSLEKQTGWLRDGSDNAIDNPNVAGTQTRIDDNTSYAFSAKVDGALLPGSTDTVYNDNIFKNIKGMAGLFQSDLSSSDGLDHAAVAGQHLIIKDKAGTLMGDAYTDADGWYYAQFLATGKATDYRVYWDQNNDNKIGAGEVYKATQMGGTAGKYANVDWTVVNPLGYDPAHNDTKIDGYTSLLA